MDYDWRADILDVTDDADEDQEIYWEGKDQLDIFRRAAEVIVEERGEDCYDDLDEVINDEMSDIIGLWAIPQDSELYDLLVEWYDGSYSKMMDHVRNSFEQDGYLFFVTGCGYSIWSADLFGGGVDGEAEREFDAWVRSK